jgi:hypothetical protein
MKTQMRPVGPPKQIEFDTVQKAGNFSAGGRKRGLIDLFALQPVDNPICSAGSAACPPIVAALLAGLPSGTIGLGAP